MQMPQCWGWFRDTGPIPPPLPTPSLAVSQLTGGRTWGWGQVLLILISDSLGGGGRLVLGQSRCALVKARALSCQEVGGSEQGATKPLGIPVECDLP